MKNKKLIYLALTTAFLLLIPLVAMQFTREVKWTVFDFIFAGALIFGIGFLFELARKKAAGNRAYQLGAALVLAAAFLLIWISGAVGIIGSENDPINLLYLGVIGIGIVGALIARFQPKGMARALFLTAMAQALVPIVALLTHSQAIFTEPPGVIGVFVINLFFIILFAGSALLFRLASRDSGRLAS
jgi:hypothetical protein